MLGSFLSKGQRVNFAALKDFTKLSINHGHKSLLLECFGQALKVAAKCQKFNEFNERRFGLLA